ncbi:MAG: LuxR C-terminal-related transcriptional regulator, partial [Prochlorothrix sp.]|nr:LuxR C-terminal-related transcriptional regulator [Prochlorothrix sp.]
ELHLSPRTVEKYVSRLLRKTETANRAELVRFAVEHHLIKPRTWTGAHHQRPWTSNPCPLSLPTQPPGSRTGPVEPCSPRWTVPIRVTGAASLHQERDSLGRGAIVEEI